MNILFVNNSTPLFENANCGGSVRSMNLIRALLQLGHVDVISFLDNEVSTLADCDVLYSRSIPNSSKSASNRHKIALLFHHNHPNDVFPVNEEKSKVVDYHIKQKDYAYIVTRYIGLACGSGLLKYANRLIIDIDDDPAAYVRLVARSYSLLGRIYRTLFYSRYVDQITRKVLPTIYKAFNSEPDKTYPNTIFLPNISLQTDALPEVDFNSVPNTILFVGNMDHEPNRLALYHFLRDIYPLVVQSQPSISLHIVGKLVDAELIRLCEASPNVVLRGFVEDIREEYRMCRCAIIPLSTGTGTSVKLVEALSLGRAVVTTSAGRRGLHKAFVAGEDYLLADNDKDFAVCVIRLVTDEVLNCQLSAQALVKIRTFYSAEWFNAIVAEAIEQE